MDCRQRIDVRAVRALLASIVTDRAPDELRLKARDQLPITIDIEVTADSKNGPDLACDGG